MTPSEMISLKNEFGQDMEIWNSTHLHDEDEWNKYEITYRGVTVGSELVSADFVRDYIRTHFN